MTNVGSTLREPDAYRSTTPHGELRRDYATGIPALVRWATNPVSERGVSSLHRARFALSAPDWADQLDRMERDAVGSRVLADRPDLGAALSDMEALAALPEGSLGRAYHAFMDRPEVIPSSLLASLMHRDGHFERLPWDDDMKYFAERRTHTHDLTHLFSGYGTSLPAEAINIGFTIGIEEIARGRVVSEGLAAVTYAIMLPSVGARRWRQLVVEAYERGAAAARRRPLVFLYIEELLPLPLDEALREIGIPPLASPVVAPESWIRSPLGKKMAHGYGGAGSGDEGIQLAIALLRAGAPCADLGRADPALNADLLRRRKAGASIDELVVVLADGAEALRAADHRAVATRAAA